MTRTVTSRDNPLLQVVRRLVRQPGAYRREGLVWLEGEHLCAALCDSGGSPRHAIVSQSAMEQPVLQDLLAGAPDVVMVPDRLFADLSPLPSPSAIGFLYAVPQASQPNPSQATLVLDRVQDAGNVGSLLRTAAAFGVRQVVALEGTAGLWSPKVLRAGMGAQFRLKLVEQARVDDVLALGQPLVATSSHAAASLMEADLPASCAWVFGHEGQGVDPALQAACALTVRIPQPGGGESMNVAAAGAVCLYESLRRQTRPG